MQVISAPLCLLSFQSETMLGVTLLWQSTHSAGVAVCAGEATDVAMKNRTDITTRNCFREKNKNDCISAPPATLHYPGSGKQLAVTSVTANCWEVVEFFYEKAAPIAAPASVNTIHQPNTTA